MDRFIEANAVFSIFCSSYTALKKELPIRPSEMGVLNIIVLRDGRFTPLMLAELLEVSKPMVTAHITVLERKGYIQKEYSQEDRRSFFVRPTDKARELVKTTAEKMERFLRQLEESLGSEQFDHLVKTVAETNTILKQIKEEAK